jgi:hypothetical protein
MRLIIMRSGVERWFVRLETLPFCNAFSQWVLSRIASEAFLHIKIWFNVILRLILNTVAEIY